MGQKKEQHGPFLTEDGAEKQVAGVAPGTAHRRGGNKLIAAGGAPVYSPPGCAIRSNHSISLYEKSQFLHEERVERGIKDRQ